MNNAMIKVRLLATGLLAKDAQGNDAVALIRQPGLAFIRVDRIDTITPLTTDMVEAMKLPPAAKCVVRYDDRVYAYRLFYVCESAESLAISIGAGRMGACQLPDDLGESR